MPLARVTGMMFARRMNGGHRFEMGIEISLLAEISW